MTGIIAFFQVLPKIISLMERLGRVIEEKKINDWLDNLEKAVDLVESAKTPEDRKNAAQALARSIRGLR